MAELAVRHIAVHATAVFMSHDIGIAVFENWWGLARLMEYVAEKVSVDVGSLTTFSLSAHKYIGA